MDISTLEDKEILKEIERRFMEKNASIVEMEFMTKKLLEMNEQTKKAESIKGEFLSIIKNEFNNPLSTLLNFAQALEKKRSPERLDEIVRMLNMELVRLDFHFKNVFAASEIEAGETANYFTGVDFEELCQDVLRPLRYIVGDKNLTITFRNTLEGKFVSDTGKLYLIMLNLLSNAVEFSFPDTEIVLFVDGDEEQVAIGVEDRGEGIKVEHHAMIFDRFSKFSSGRTRAHTGLGLGLSVVRGMAEALGGDVLFESQEGHTIFRVLLPRKLSEMEMAEGDGDANMTLFEDFSDGEMLEM